MALLWLGHAACAQTLNYDLPLHVAQVRLPLNHPPVIVACSYAPGMAQETRYWQKNISDDGVFFVHLRPGQVTPPSCDKAVPQPDPPLVVTCTTYPGFMVKDRHVEGDEGDAGVSVVKLSAGRPVPSCDDAAAPRENMLRDKNEGGAFDGVKGAYLFLAEPDTDLFGAWNMVVYRTDSSRLITDFTLLNNPASALQRTPDGLSFRLTTYVSQDCGVGGNGGAACLARLEQTAGTKIALAQCVKAEPKDFPTDPIAIAYPALLSVRGSHAVLRATGPATACIASE